MTISEWLDRLGLGQYAQAFAENDIDLEVVVDLTADDLTDIGVKSVGHRRRILKAAEEIRSGGDAGGDAGDGAAARGLAEAAPGFDKAPAPAPEPAAARSAERRQLTVLFADMVGSTSLSEQLDPEEMSAVIGEYQRAVVEEVKRFEGYVAQYLGDGVIAYFGYPMAHENEPERAVRAGLAIIEAVAKLTDPAGKPLASRVGVATGLVVVGDLFGKDSEQHDSVIGDTPNLAARLQALGKPNQLIIAPDTRRLIGTKFELESLGSTPIKGLSAPIEPWLVTGSARENGDADHERHMTPILGREPEQALLRSRWASACEGEPQLVLMSGDAGIGKSRLAEDVVGEVGRAGHPVHRLYCSPFHTSAAYHPVIGWLQRAAGMARGDSQAERLDKLDRMVEGLGLDPMEVGPLVAPLLSLEPGDRYPPLKVAPTALKGRTFDALGDVMLAGAAQAPLLVVLEDAHWIDPTTTELLEHLFTAAEGRRVMFLVTFRPEFEHAWRGAAIASTAIELGRLPKSRIRDLVRSLTGGKELPDEVLEHILAKTDGIPLFVEEMTKSILDSALLTDAGDHYDLAGPMASFSVPTTLKDSLMSRLDRLSPVKEIAQIGSVLGRRFSRALLAAVAGMDDVRLDSALDALVEAELVHRSGSAENRIYTFKHALIRDAAYESLLNRRRVELHGRIAEVGEERFPELANADPQLLAHHFERANRIDRAVPYWLQAGRKAMEASAMIEAVNHLDHGLSLVGQVEDQATRDRLEFGLRMSLGLAHISQQGWQADIVGEHLRPAYEIGQRLGETENLLMVMYGIWIHSMNRAEFAESQRWIDRAIEDFGDAGSDDWALVIHTMEVIQQRWSGSHARVEEEANKVLELYDPERHGKFVYMFGNDPRVAALGFQSWSSWMCGDPEKAERERRACAEHSAEVDHPFDRCWQLMVGSLVSYFSGDRDSFAASVAEARRIGDEQSVPFVQFILGPVWAGLVHIMDGEWQEATEIMPQGIEVWKQMGGGVAIPFWEASLGHAHVQLGAYETGLALMDSAIATAERTGEYWYEPEIHRLKGEAILTRDPSDTATAQRCFERAVELARAQGARTLERLAQENIDRIAA